MNEQAIQDSYNIFVSQGYNKSIDEYKKLIATNPNALNDSYKLFTEKGYNKSIDDYKVLMGIGPQAPKKKDSSESLAPQEPQAGTMVSPSADGSSVTPPINNAFQSIDQFGGKSPVENLITTQQKTIGNKKFSLDEKPKKLVGSDARIAKSLSDINTDLINQTEEDVVNQLSKDQTLKDLGFSFEEAGWTGDYMKVTAPDGETTIEISLDNLLDSKSAKQSLALQNFIKNNTTKEKRAELDKFVALEEAEEKKLQSEKKKFGDMFDRQLNVKPKPSESKYLNERLSVINTDLMNQTEENVVAEMEYQFGDLDFKFQKTGALGDYMLVTAPNKKTKEVSLDNFLNSKSSREANELKKFIKDNTPAKGLFVLENTVKYKDKKFNSEKQIEDVTKNLSNEFNELNAKQKQFLIKKSQFEKQVEDLTSMSQNSEEFKAKYAELETQEAQLKSELKTLLDSEDTIGYKKRKLDKSVGNYMIMRSKQGGAFGGLQDALAKFPGTMAALATNIMTDIHGSFGPIVKDSSLISQFVPPLYSADEATDLAFEAAEKLGFNPPKDRTSQEAVDKFKASLTEDQMDQIESYIRDQSKKSTKKDLLPLMREGFLQLAGDPETTKEWSEEKKKGFWGAALLGTAESIPAIMGGWQQRSVQMYAMVSDALAQEMENNPKFKDVTENEKLAVTLPIGIVGAVLEQVGFRNLKQSKGLIASITLSVLGKSGTGITAKTFRELVENEVENRMAKGLLVLGAAGAAEFETGAAQELTETFGKEVFNEIKEKKLFETPGSVEDWIENIAVAGAQEAVGGFVLGTPSAISAAYSKKGFLKMDDLTFQTFANMANDEKLQSAYIISLKDKITRGILTVKQAKEQLNNYRNSAGLYRQLTEGLTTEQQKEAMNLLKEKRDLENFVEGKDPALVVKAKNRITEINDSLTKLSETNAVQEQTTDESVLRTEQPEVGLQEVVEGDTQTEVVTEQGTQEVTPSETIINAQEVVGIPDEISQPIELSVNETPIERTTGIPDEVSQPIELSVTPEVTPEQVSEEVNSKILELENQRDAEIEALKAKRQYDEKNIKPIREKYEALILDEKSKEQAPAETTTEAAPVAETPVVKSEQDIASDLKNRGDVEDLKQRKDINHNSTKIEYNGNSKRIKDLVDRYNKLTRKVEEDGSFNTIYGARLIENLIRKGIDSNQTRKLSSALRKAGLLDITSSQLTKGSGGIGLYISDTSEFIANAYSYQSTDKLAATKILTKLAKELGVDVASLETEANRPVEKIGAETKAETAPVEVSPEVKTTDKFEDVVRSDNKALGMEQVGFSFKGSDGNVHKVDMFVYYSTGNTAFIRVDGDMNSSFKNEADNYYKKLKEETETKAETAPVEEVKGKLDELLELDPADKTTLGKISSGLEDMINEFKRIEKDLGSNILLVPMRYVLQGIKALVDGGMTLQEAIKEVAADQNFKVRDVIKGINDINEIAKIATAYGALMEKADKLIARQKATGITDKKILSNLDTMIRKSPIYTDPNTTDAQRKIMEREARAKMGVAPKKSVSIGRVIGALNDIRNVSRTEKLKIISRIRELSKDAAKDLVEEIRELAKKGNITTTQAVNIISRFGKVNMLNEASVSNFVDYMAKVFADAEYDNKIKVAKGKLKNARKNIYTKIGIANGLVGPLQKLFAINPELIPESKLERYLELVDMFGARQAVLSLEEKAKLTNDVLDILDEVNNERSAVDDLSYRLNYSDNKVIEDGKLDYAATVKNMLKEGDITEEEAALMTKYKSEILPQTEKSSLSEQELQQEKDELLDEVKKSTINADDLPTRTERDAAKKLAALIKSPAVKELSNAQLKNLLKVIDNINNGYFAHSAQLIIEEINSINSSKTLASSVNRARLLPLSKLYAQVKSFVTRKDAVLEMIRRNPLFNIDQVLGDFKTKDVFNSILNKAAEAESKFTSELKAIQSKLSIAEEKIAKSFKLNANKVLMSKFKIMTYMVQLEYKSNPDSKQVNPAAKFIEATINHIDEGNSQFGEKDAEMLQDILDNYTDSDGNIDINKLYNSFNGAEKAAIKTIQEVNKSLTEKAEYTASVIRGQRINPLSNYIHLNVLSDTNPNDLQSGGSFADQYNNSLRPSTKAKSLIERTGKVSPLNFDVFASAQKGAKFVLMDFHLTEPIRTARKTINKATTELGKEGRISKDKRRIINAIKNSFEETVENLVKNSYIETSIGEDVANYIKKQGYRSVLAGTGRFVAEFLSNVGFVIISDPTTFAEGLKYTSVIMSPDAPSIMNNVNSKEINRIFPSDTLSGRLIDTNILNEANGIKGGKAKNKVINRVQQIWNLTGKKYKNAVELTADILISTPDKAIMRPIWFGSFAANFKNETGQDVDFKKIAANDEAYMNKYKDAIEKAKNSADERSVITGASNNAFTGILKGTSKPTQNKIVSPFVSQFNNFNNFMTRFLIYEYTSARTGIMAAMGNGSLSRRQGIALLGAVTTRMTVYSLLSKALGSGLIGLLFGGDDDDEEEKKSLDKSIGQALTSTFTSLLFNRDFGNATKMIINEGIENINENYLQDLREGDYDPYKDAIQYTAIPIEKKGKQTGLYDFIENMSGSYGPAIKTTNLIIKTYRGEDKKESDAIERQEDVKNIRIPLEVLGNAGFIPLYKDIRKEVMKEIYKGIGKKAPIIVEEEEEEGDNKEELSQDQEIEKAIKEMEKELE
jgi:hypothetical protein